MNVRYTLIVFLFFVAAVLFLFTQRDREPTRVGPGAPTETPEPVLSLDAADIQEVAVVGATGAYTLTRVAGGWEVGDQPASTEVDSIVSSLSEPSVLRVLPEDRRPDEYGFATPSLTITMRTAAGDEHVLLVGDDTAADPQVFVRLGVAGRIFVISSYEIDRLKEWLVEPPLAPTATPEPTSTDEGGEEEATDEPAAADGETEAEPGEDAEGTPESTGTAVPTGTAAMTAAADATVTPTNTDEADD